MPSLYGFDSPSPMQYVEVRNCLSVKTLGRRVIVPAYLFNLYYR